MSKSLKVAGSAAATGKPTLLQKTKSVALNTLKFGTAVSLGVMGTGVALGVKAKHSMDDAIDAYADGLSMALISSLSVSKFEAQLGLHAHQHQCKRPANGMDWAMASAYASNQPQYGG